MPIVLRGNGSVGKAAGDKFDCLGPIIGAASTSPFKALDFVIVPALLPWGLMIICVY